MESADLFGDGSDGGAGGTEPHSSLRPMLLLVAWPFGDTRFLHTHRVIYQKRV